jgi:hypothetical protein
VLFRGKLIVSYDVSYAVSNGWTSVEYVFVDNLCDEFFMLEFCPAKLCFHLSHEKVTLDVGLHDLPLGFFFLDSLRKGLGATDVSLIISVVESGTVIARAFVFFFDVLMRRHRFFEA